MPIYKLVIEEVSVAIAEVEAEDEHEAEDKGYALYGDGDLHWGYGDVSVTVEH